jgi:transposase
MISAVSARGHMRFMLAKGRVNGAVFVEFLKRLMHNAGQPIFLILDGGSYHHSRLVKDYVASLNGKLRLFFLPPYSPELNPDEQVWNYLKHHGVAKAGLRSGKELRKYVLERLRSLQRLPWTVFSSLTASVDGNVTFEPWGGESSMIGTLSVPMASRIVINDGQHRRAGIEEALKNKPDLGEETLSIVFFIDDGLRRSQQMFADLNKHAIRPTKSLGILYDLRDPLSKLARDLASEVPSFKGLTKTEKLQFQIVQLSWSTGRVFI